MSCQAGGWVGRVEVAVDLSGEVALQGASYLLRGASFRAASRDVFAGHGVVGHAGDGRHVEDAVQASVSTSVESVTDRVS